MAVGLSYNRRLLRVIVGAIVCWGVFFSVNSALASLFCVSGQGGSHCVFDSAALCRQEAERVGGGCSVNLSEVSVFSGGEPVCLVFSPTTALCYYNDFSSCQRDAEKNNAACANNSSLQIFRDTRGGAMDTQRIDDED